MRAWTCILLFYNCCIYIEYVNAHNIISDTINEYCIDVHLCNVAGIFGHVDCINDKCVCVNNTKYIVNNDRDIMGCYKKSKLGEECEFDLDCWDMKDSKCSEALCKKTCECLPNRENINGTCVVTNNKSIGTYCEKHSECSANLKCLNNKCNCEADQFYADNKCFRLKEYNMCRNHAECSENHFCEKNADLVYGFCRLSGQRLYSLRCSTKEDCRINGHIDCEKGICTCVDNSTFNNNNNGCYKQNRFGEICTFREDCDDKMICKLDHHTNISRCMCPEYQVYYEYHCINIACLNRETCKIDKECKNNEKCVLDVKCNQSFCQCPQGTMKINDKCMDIHDLDKPRCEQNSDCKIKYSMCEENFCKCPDGTILLHNECIELKEQKYGDYCRTKCRLPDTKCIRSDESSIIGVCGCADNYFWNTMMCMTFTAVGEHSVSKSEYRNAASIVSSRIYYFTFTYIIVAFAK